MTTNMLSYIFDKSSRIFECNYMFIALFCKLISTIQEYYFKYNYFSKNNLR